MLNLNEIKTVPFQNEFVEIRPCNSYEWLIETSLVARLCKVSVDAIQAQGKRHRDELVENKHFITADKVSGVGIKPNSIFWTRRGVIRLCFFMRGEVPKKVRDWAEDLIINKPDATPQYNLPASYKEALLQLVERIEQNEQLENQVKELAPKAEYTDKVLRSSTKITTTLIAKELGVSARKLNTKLHELKVQYKQGSNWVLYSKYDNMGFVDYYTYAVTKFNGEVETRQQMMWTESGRNFIHHLLKNSQLAH